MTNRRDLIKKMELAGMVDGLGEAVPSPDQGTLCVASIKLVGEGDNASFQSNMEIDEELSLLVLKGTEPGGLSAEDERKRRSLMPPPDRYLTGPELDDVLDRFVNLEGRGDVAYLKFATHFGFLHLCYQHGLPSPHLPIESSEDLITGMPGRNHEPCGFGNIEMLRHWRWLVKRNRSLLMITALLRAYPPKIGSVEDWQALDWDACVQGKTVGLPTSLEDAWCNLENYLNYGHLVSGIKPFSGLSNKRSTPGFQGSTLWHHIATQLLFRIGAGDGLCVECFKPRGKGSRQYCIAHQADSDRLRKRNNRAKKRLSEL